MTISKTCAICKSANRRLAARLMSEGGMAAMAIANTLDGVLSVATVERHLNDHYEGEVIIVVDQVMAAKSARERVLALQTMQLDEFERRIDAAKARANELNAFHSNDSPDEWRLVDWSEYIDILSKDMQAAIGSILKSQGISDKRDKTQGELKLGLFEAMVGAGLAPKGISGGKLPALQAGDENEADDGWQERGDDDE